MDRNHWRAFFGAAAETLEAGIASLRAHEAYIAGLGREFDAADFLRNMAGYGGMVAGCEFALTLQRYEVG